MDDDEREVVVNLDDLNIFFGDTNSYEEYKKTHNITDTDDDEENQQEEEKEKIVPKMVLSKETLKKIDDETMKILRRTRCVNDYEEVFMQSSMEFYDEYYLKEDVPPELIKARAVRRIYRDYSKYLNAIKDRNAYIDTLIEKYGEDKFLKNLSLGLINEWIPPMPILSRRAKDYDLYLAGIIPTEKESLPDDALFTVMDGLREELGDVELIQMSGPETSIGEINLVNSISANTEGCYRGSYGTSGVQNLDELNKIFHSWYKSDKTSDGERQFFKNAPENLRKRFDEWSAYNERGLLARIANGEQIEEEPVNMNETVYDEKTERPMTRREFEQRQVIRFLGKHGWSESRLLNYQNIGSALEKGQRKRKSRRRKRIGADEIDMSSFYNDDTGLDPMYSENEAILDSIYNLMRRD